ncbi:MAG: FkbM family methyltransferase [Firmicutes bacterium]|nr:FkbM family methyltransferase [Bacillota bacterium]
MWNEIAASAYPVVLYGTGNAAQKIISICNQKNIGIAGIFASDAFVRDRSFAGYPVISYEEAKKRFGRMTVLLCFGSHLPDVIDNFKRIDAEQNLYAPDLPIAGGELFDKDYKYRHAAELSRALMMLADDESRRVFAALIDYKLSGRIKYLFDCESPDDENWALLGLNDHETYFDLGAYNGDTLRQFIKSAGGSYSSITAVEPEARNYRKLSEYAESLYLRQALTKSGSSVNLINKAVSDKAGTLYFEKGSGRGGAAGKGKTVEVECTSVDLLAEQLKLSPTFIKMDLEGMEQKALTGASHVIAANKPKMLISAYHRSQDIFAIPLMIKNIRPDYKVYLRHSPCIPAWEFNYYFV